MATLLFLQAAGTATANEALLPDSGWSHYGQALGSLLLVLLLLVLVVRYVLPALPVARPGAHGLLRVRGSLALETRKRIYLVEAGGKVLMIACSESSISLLDRFDVDQFQEVEQPHAAPLSFARILRGKG
ncbi:MAG: flagellar biosynthetic protein FliO [Bryobacterales bacterium]|nr:flagellar biosynthetic protein FliO [Bryobacterales bacterium]